MDNINNKFFLFSLYFIILLGCILRTITWFTQSYDVIGDDCSSFVSIYSPVKEMILHYRQGANFLPGYSFILYVIYHFFGFNWLVCCFPNLIASILSIFLFKNIIQRVFVKKLPMLFAMVLFSLSYYAIFSIVRVKPYAIDLLCSCLLIYAFLNLNDKKEDYSARKIILYTLIAPFIMITSIPSIPIIWLVIFILLIKNLYLKNKKNIIKISVSGLFLAIFTAIEYFGYIVEMRNDSALGKMWFDSGDFYYLNTCLKSINSIIQNLFFHIEMNDVYANAVFPNIILIFISLLFIFGIIILLKNLFKKDENQFIGLFITASFLCFIILSILKIYPMANRLILFLLPFVTIILLKPFDIVKNKITSNISNIFCIITIILYLTYIFTGFRLFKDIQDTREAKGTKQAIALIINENKIPIISLETGCALCIENNNIIYLRAVPSDTKFDLFMYRKKTLDDETVVQLSDLVKDSKKIIFLETRGTEENELLQKEFEKLGYRDISNNHEVYEFLNYIIYSKD